ncbi:tyrosine-type recombinase/integrase [Paraglaciecola marina]|uniref:tyrosine-type recombinase/integrase n=1 Tax=Paraglaciecola marina TaxID=2500157 RepID=UPI00105C605C|nr:tyrosine-type recombinase/integrase [Paraglaciecola marina]
MTARNTNHPQKGAAIKVHPIRELAQIAAIKANLKSQPRNYCLFVFGINTAFRANELLSLKIKQVANLKVGSRLEVKQSKTGKYRAVTINKASYAAIQFWLKQHPRKHEPKCAFFLSQRTRSAIRVSTLNRLVKSWCRLVGVTENTGSHTLRKTWGYQQRMHGNASIPVLMVAFGHTSEHQTLEYLCIQADEVQALYFTLEL